MKRIEFIAPVEAMRGNLSGTQKNLEYPTDNNAAYESPVGSRNYARNYRPCFIGAKRAADGLKYFGVRTKSSIGMTSKAKHAMALLGGTGALYGAIVRDKSDAIYLSLLNMYNRMVDTIPSFKVSFHKWLSNQLYTMLADYKEYVTIAGPGGSVQIDNPWMYSADEPNIHISSDILKKFWTELRKDGIVIKVQQEIDGLQDFYVIKGKTFAESRQMTSHLGIPMLAVRNGYVAALSKIDLSHVDYLISNDDPSEPVYIEESTVILATDALKVFLTTTQAPA